MKKTIWITGSTSGVGESLTYQLLAEGYRVVALARNEDKLQQLKQAVAHLPGEAICLVADVTKSDQITEAIDYGVRYELGFDILINNAGLGVFDPLLEAKHDDIDEMFAVNVLGMIKLTKAILPYMVKAGKGHIIQLGSQAGKIATPKSSGYVASKHAVIGFSNSLRMEVKDLGIHVSVVNPGPIRTAFFERADKTGTYVQNVGKLMLEPDYVAKRIIQLIDKPKREVNMPQWMALGATLYQLMPTLVERIGKKQFMKK